MAPTLVELSGSTSGTTMVLSKNAKVDKMSQGHVAQIAKAVGVVGRLDNISDQLAGKNLTCDYIKNNQGYTNAKNFRPLGSLKSEPAPKPKPQTEGPTSSQTKFRFDEN